MMEARPPSGIVPAPLARFTLIGSLVVIATSRS